MKNNDMEENCECVNGACMVPSVLKTKASDELEKQIEAELEVEDPEEGGEAVAKLLKAKEIKKTDDL